jgi:ribonuclease BN (tRNA processing enzyme)
MLNFIGIGSAFNTRLGNNGAFIKSVSGKKLFMIDCGEVTFDRLQRFGVLDGVEEVHVLLTHFHPDHIGSLGTLAFYMYYKEQPFQSRITIYTPENISLYQYLNATGVSSEYYYDKRLDGDGIRNLINFGEGLERFFITPIRVQHDKNLVCYGYYIESLDLDTGKVIYYSGDTKIIPQNVIDDLSSGTIHTMYQDTSTHDYEGNVHLSLKKLDELIPQTKNIRDKIYCMHLDKDWSAVAAKDLGFSSVKSIC